MIMQVERAEQRLQTTDFLSLGNGTPSPKNQDGSRLQTVTGQRIPPENSGRIQIADWI